MKILEILIKPSYDSTRKSMGISKNEDYDSDSVLFQQGYDIFPLNIEQGEKFKIKKNFTGHIDCEETQYKIINIKKEWEDDEDNWEDDYYQEGDPITLQPGKYRFMEDGISIEEIAKKE
jgi:hypothetical protein